MARRTLVVAIGVAAILTLPSRADAAGWLEVRSGHFTVLSDASERRARQVAWQFEQIRGAIRRLWPWASTDFPIDVVVYAARDEPTMRALLPGHFEGRGAIRPDSLFVSSPAAHLVAIRSDVKVESQGLLNAYRASYWSYMSLVIRTTYGRELPLWYVRGLAEVFSNTVVRREQVLVGPPIPWHLERLRTRGRPSLDVLLAVADGSPFMRHADRMAEFDASAWALVHYMLLGNKGENLARMNDFAAAVRRGTPVNDALSKVYGDMRAVSDALARYIDQNVYVYQQVPIETTVNADAFSARALTAPEAALVQARLHAALDRPVEARQQIAAAAGAPAASEVEAILLDREDKTVDARAAYARASDAGAATFYGEYRLATLLWPSGDVPPDDPGLAAVEKCLRRAVTLNPRFAPAFALLAQTLVRRDRPEDALPYGQRSVTLAPLEPMSYESLARVYWALQRREEAVASVKRALAVATDTGRGRLQRLLDAYARAQD